MYAPPVSMAVVVGREGGVIAVPGLVQNLSATADTQSRCNSIIWRDVPAVHGISASCAGLQYPHIVEFRWLGFMYEGPLKVW